MLANQLRKTLRATTLWRESRPAINHLDTALLFALALALHTKDLSDLTPVTVQIVIEIRTGGHLAPFETAVAFLDLLERLPSAPIGLGVFKKEFPILAGDWSIVFDEQHGVAASTLNEAPKIVRTLGGMAAENAPFAQRLR